MNIKIRSEYSCDVLVVGGGVAGFAAAIAAAREGADICLTEKNGMLGGCATAGLVSPFMTCYDADGEVQIIRGIFEEMVGRLVELGGAVHHSRCKKCDSYSGYKLSGHLGTTPVDSEILKLVMDRMCQEAGVRVKFHTHFIDCERDGRKIKSCVFATKNGLSRISAKQFIDCTGDAAVCYEAGGEYMFSDEAGELQPVTTFLKIDNVDKEALDAAVYRDGNNVRARFFMNEVEAAKERGEFPCATGLVRIYEQPNGIFSINMCHIDEVFDVNDPDKFSDAEMEGRRQAYEIFKFLKRDIPGLENARLIATSSTTGVRESRRIVGEYVLKTEDLVSSKQFDDAIALAANSIDVHRKKATNYRPFTNKIPYTIPYSCLVSRSFDNLLSAGKTASADRQALGAIRVIPPAMATGQAAGAAAAIAAEQDISAKDVPYAELKAALVRGGVYFG